jgi:hypothetical protein
LSFQTFWNVKFIAWQTTIFNQGVEFTVKINVSENRRNFSSIFDNLAFITFKSVNLNIISIIILRGCFTSILRDLLLTYELTYLRMWYNQYLFKACWRRSFHDCLPLAQCVQSLTPAFAVHPICPPRFRSSLSSPSIGFRVFWSCDQCSAICLSSWHLGHSGCQTFYRGHLVAFVFILLSFWGSIWFWPLK